jgi:hypothetical protein
VVLKRSAPYGQQTDYGIGLLMMCIVWHIAVTGVLYFSGNARRPSAVNGI